jgi:type IV pilus assembly protein PilE
MTKRDRGFTLLELMIVVAVIAILAGIAIGAYTKQVRKSRRAEAKQALSDISLREEKWRSTRTLYLGANSSTADKNTFGALPTSSYYNIAITTNEHAQNFTITATPKTGNDQAKDTCGTLTFQSQAGVVTKLPATGGCW